MFERSRLLLEEYYALRLSKGISRSGEHLLHEVRVRLRTLAWLYERLIELDGALEREHRQTNKPKLQGADVVQVIYTNRARPTPPKYDQGKVPFSTPDELRLLLEGFYYSAHRVRDIFRDNVNGLPGLSNFEAEGVRNVRNHLVEHPTKKSGVPVYTVAAGGPTGPQLRPIQWSGDQPGTLDQGLRQNADEFEKALNSALEHAIQEDSPA